MTNLLRKKYDMMLATLPSGRAPRAYYTELEYIESTGTQYIDTGFVPSGNTRVLFDYQPTSGYTGVSCIFGCQTSPAGNNCNRFYYLLSGQTLYRAQFNYTNTGTSSQSTPAYWGINYDSSTNQYSLVTGANGTFASDSSRQTIDIDGYNKTIQFNNGNIIDMSGDATFAKGMHPTHSMFIFDRSLGGTSSSNKFKGKIYYFKIWDSSILVRDFIPVLDWNYVPCMYDRVTKQLFYNQGTGDFISGREIHEVEYIENVKDTSTTTNPATQYIDTGIVPAGTKISGKIKYCYVDKIVTEAMVGGTTADNTANLRIGTLTGKYRIKWNNVKSSDNGVDYTGETLEPLAILEDEFNSDTGFFSNGVQLVDKHLTSISACTNTIKLFTDTTTGSVLGYNSSGKRLYYCQIYQDDVLVRDFIPAVDENGVGFLFDKANRKIYDNAGTGSFSYPDVELEYIESTGTQYFNTGYIQNQNTEFSVDCAFTDLSVGRFGSTKLFGSSTYRFYFGVLDNKWIGAVNSGTYNHNIENADFNRHNFRLDNTGLYIDGVLKVVSSNSYPETPIGIFYLPGSNLPTEASAKLYGCTIGEGGVLVKNYIPVIHNGVACLKNTINNTYLTNAGTSAFLTGKIKESA